MATKKYYRSSPYLKGQDQPYKVSRSKIELFMQCKRCFYLDVRYKITRPSSPPFNINKAIDELFKKEFDEYRVKKQPHPIMVENKLDLIPYAHADLDKWRYNFTGVGYLDPNTNLYVFGAIDDVWADKDNKLVVVDYKATAKDSEVSINSAWQISYKRQMEVYQWLLRKNGFDVNEVGYFVYTNGRLDADGFFDKLEFKTKLLEYSGDDSWIESTLKDMKSVMDGDKMPAVGVAAMGGECEFCSYARSRTELTLEALNIKLK